MADVKPSKSQTAKQKADADLTPQELEAKKASEEAKAEEARQANIKKLIKSKKYYLPIK